MTSIRWKVLSPFNTASTTSLMRAVPWMTATLTFRWPTLTVAVRTLS